MSLVGCSWLIDFAMDFALNLFDNPQSVQPLKMKSERFIIRKIIGEGAYSTVYKAFDTEKNTTVAIKIFSGQRRAGVNAGEYGKDSQEYEVLDALKDCENEHIVKFYGHFKKGFYIFELCECNLISFINEHELDLKGVKKIVRMILIGVHELHQRGIIHRDIKLGNILVKDDCIKLCDFGLSCFTNENDFCYCGTKDYLAPEMRSIAKGGLTVGTYNEKIDIYAIGVIYKVLLSRKKESDLDKILTDENIKDLIQQMTCIDPKERMSAKQALFHHSFDDLIYEIPDFTLLKNLSKTTKYGRISRFADSNHNFIQIEYLSEGKPHQIRVNWIARSMLEGEYQIEADGVEINKKLFQNSMLKHFNYLCSYIKIVCEKTIKYRDMDGRSIFFVTAADTKYLECNGLQIKKYKNGHYEVNPLGEERAAKSGDNLKEMVLSDVSIREMNLFNLFEQKYLRAGNFHIEQHSSMQISLKTDQLIRKYEFIENCGWILKNRLNFVFLLNNGKRYMVDAEEQMISENEEHKMDLSCVSLDLLLLIREAMVRFAF